MGRFYAQRRQEFDQLLGPSSNSERRRNDRSDIATIRRLPLEDPTEHLCRCEVYR